jgi:CubicO group peptidase (beta-lactamase class C family)
MEARNKMLGTITLPIDGNFKTQPEWLHRPRKSSGPQKTGKPNPQWSSVFETNLTDVPGYAYAVAHNGNIVAEGASGFARTYLDTPETHWTIHTRIHLASVSKCITTVALLKLLGHHKIPIDQPFYPLLQNRCPTAGSGVDTVTFKNLLEMKSGMVVDGTLSTPDLWSFLSSYLTQGLAGTPGVTSAYSNTNFTILQAIISILSDSAGPGGDGIAPYVKYVTDHVLGPMGIYAGNFNTSPGPPASAALSYALSDNGPGFYWGPFDCVGCGGWVGSARELIKFLIGVREARVLDHQQTQRMFHEQLGWYLWNGVYGDYFDHNGWLEDGGTPNRGLNTGIIHLADGYDALLLVNAQWVDTIGLLVQAFEQ